MRLAAFVVFLAIWCVDDGGADGAADSAIFNALKFDATSLGLIDVEVDLPKKGDDSVRTNDGLESDLDEEEVQEGYTDGWRQLKCRMWNKVQGSGVVRLWFQGGTARDPDQDFGLIVENEHMDLTCYSGNTLYITRDGNTERVQTFTVRDGKTEFFLDGKDKGEKKFDPEAEAKRAKFAQEYFKKTGRRWLQIYPREPVSFHMYEPIEVGYKHEVSSRHFKWERGMKALPDGDDLPDMVFELETVSESPRVFAVHDVLSDDECDYIVERARPKLKRSMVTTSGVVSNIRTSSNAWLPTSTSKIIHNVFSRIADVLQIDEELMRHDMAAENLQVVHYEDGQQYQEHHDYLEPQVYKDSENVQRGNNRLVTILFYLNDIEAGGHTAFPDSSEGDLKVRLPKGSAVIFYSMLPDGNLDIKSRHAGRPPTSGEKWVANLWVWEPRWL